MTQKFHFVVSELPEQIVNILKGPSGDSVFRGAAYSEYSHLCGSPEWDWIIQTFLQMKQKGLDVALVNHPIPNSICIAHFVATKNKVWPSDCFIVGIRSDTSPMYTKDFEIVQSPAVLSKKKSSFVCLWPQANISLRDPNRENRVETISYFGGSGGLSPAFRSLVFQTSLKTLGVSLNLCFDSKQWGNYRDTDLVVAVRNHHHDLLINTKPASKLINAWQAGCVALLGNEPAYRLIGRPNENYFEVETPQDVLDIVRKLKENPSLYQQMRESGSQKYSAHSFEVIAQQWIDLLTGPVTDAFIEWQNAGQQRKSVRYLQRYWQSVQQWLSHKLFYVPVRSQALLSKLNSTESVIL